MKSPRSKYLLAAALPTVMLLATACGSGGDGGGGEDARLMRLGHPYPPGGIIGEAAEAFAAAVNEQSEGRLEVEVYASAQLGDHVQAAGAMNEGRLESYLLGINAAGIQDPDSQVGALPYLVMNHEEAAEFYFGDGAIAEIDRATLAKNGMHATEFLSQGFRGLTNNVREVVLPEDVQGLKIRTPATPTIIDTVNAWGANATNMPSGEYYAAMEQGVIDGQDNGIDVLHSLALWEVQDYFVDTNHMFNALAITFSQRVWDELSEEDREVLEDVSLQISEQQQADLLAAEEGYYQDAIDNGMTITRLTEEQRQVWRDATISVTESRLSDLSPEVAETVQAILDDQS